MNRFKSTFMALALIIWAATQVSAQVPKPEDVFGFKPGADYKLAMYGQFMDYFTKLDATSERVEMMEIGRSVLGKPLVVLFISSEENIRNLDKYRNISEQMARAKIDPATAEKNALEGKAIIWIDGGMHSTEVAGGQMTPELAYRIATEETREMKKIRDEVITIIMPMMNPDGLDIVASWYYQHLGTPYEVSNTPWLYHHYVGHDNNRDWFMSNMPETVAVNEVLYNQWFPQIIYNHHQTSPSWARIFIPPFDNPVNPRIHPGITTATNLVGMVMGNKFAMERMPGVIAHQRFSMWWNGGMRTVPYYHNMIGILTEVAHASATPRFYPSEELPKMIGGFGGGGMASNGTQIFYSDPWKGGNSTLRDAVDYMIVGSLAVLDMAADRKYEYLMNIYRMGKDAIEAKLLENSFAYVIPKKQHDVGEAMNLVNILRQGGVEVYMAEKAFTAGGKTYDPGSYIIYAAQAFRPYIVDLLEKQEHPDMYQYPGGPPVPPYDLAGWTLPMQMGVAVDKHMETFKASTTEVRARANYAASSIAGKGSFGYAYSPDPNVSAKVTNLLLAEGAKVHRLTAKSGEHTAGTFVVQEMDGLKDKLTEIAKEYGIDFTALATKPTGELKAMKRPKVGLYKSWVANMDEGWTRWLLTEYAFDWDTLHDDDIRTRNLAIYDAIILPDQSPSGILNGHLKGTMPDQYVGGMALMGTAKLNDYVLNGGKLICFDQASDFAIEQFGLPVENVTNGRSMNQFFIPGSLIRTTVNTDHPLAYGVEAEVAASFSRSRAFSVRTRSNKMEGGTITTLAPALQPSVSTVASYAKDNLLMSGWALGEKQTIGGKAAILDVAHGQGSVVLFGFSPQFRGQPRATYQLFFNALFAGAMD